ncbi:response regulator transcription factor [Arcobacteraceae bacterium]|nr:response regulator transcription factor [Arcobacteraceae bacterium]
MKVLVLEDNIRLSNLIKKSLLEEHYKVDCFNNGKSALNALENGYNCFVLDINVPSLDGISILKLIRENHPYTPVIIMSSYDDLESVKMSYEFGCDDYLRKPFYIFELINKIKKYSSTQYNYIQFDDLYKYDIRNHILYKDSIEIEVTKKEILFLELFSKHLHRVVTYTEIEEYVWEGENTTFVNIRSMIKRLRKKIPYDSVSIVKGVGYSLSPSATFSSL